MLSNVVYFRKEIAKNPPCISQENREARRNRIMEWKHVVENEEDRVGGNPLSWSDRRQQVDDYTEETASKQFRLRVISQHHLYRKRPYFSILDNSTIKEPSLDPDSDASVIHEHILAILNLQNCDGVLFHSLSQQEQESVKTYFAENHEGESYQIIH